MTMQKPTFTKPPQQGGNWNPNPSVSGPDPTVTPHSPSKAYEYASSQPGVHNPYFAPNTRMDIHNPHHIQAVPEWKDSDKLQEFIKSLPKLSSGLSYVIHRKKRNSTTQTQHGVIRYDHRGVSIVDTEVAKIMKEERPGSFAIVEGKGDSIGSTIDVERLLSEASPYKEKELAEHVLSMKNGNPLIQDKESPELLALKSKYEDLQAKYDKLKSESNSSNEYEGVDDKKKDIHQKFTQLYLKGKTVEAVKYVWVAEDFGILPKALSPKKSITKETKEKK